MIDFNDAPDQKVFSNGPIPPNSLVWVKMNIITATKDQTVSSLHPLLCLKKSTGNHFLNCQFDVISEAFNGAKLFGIFIVQGSETAMNIANSLLRAALEAARGIDPNDITPRAVQARQVSDWSDFDGLEFPIKVICEQPKAGAKYVNNKIGKIITVNMEENEQVKGGKEMITEDVIPKIPDLETQKQENPWTKNDPPMPQDNQAPRNDSIPGWAQ